MRIQHNIMAMNAYRNYNNNTSALSKNLEKLSSGYKINRAGDDAAGLAISEKMRAQITGLNAAQKNVKDGVSLVKTAEGAMQEIQDMLNRMDYLATQSANGTYDNEVDRANLQKEVDALKTEINRIADSANFNGIKLLDGSLESTPAAGAVTNITAAQSDATTSKLLPEGTVLGVNTVKHSGGADSKTAQFGISLHNVTYSNDDANGSMEITFGGDKIKISGGGSAAVLDTGDILSKLAVNNSANLDNPREMTIGTQSYAVTGSTLADQLQSWADQFNEDTTVNTNVTASVVDGTKIKFEAKAAGTAGDTQVSGVAAGLANTTTVNGADGEKANLVGKVTWTTGPSAGETLTIGSTTYEFYDSSAVGFTNFTPAAAGNIGVDLNGTTVNADWLGNIVREEIATGMSAQGFGAPTASSSGTFTIEALENGEYTGTPTAMPTISKTGNIDVSVAWDNTDAAYKAGVDPVKASVTTDIQTKVTGKLEIAGYEITTTSNDPTEQLQEFITAYNENHSDYTASWNDDNNGIKFTANNNGQLLGGGTNVTLGTDSASTFQFQATGADGGASELGREGTLKAEHILNAIMSGKAQIDTGSGYRTLSQADINGSITLSDGAKYKMTAEGDTLTFTQLENDVDSDGAFNPTTLDRQVTITSSVNADTGKNMHAGDYQKSTTFNTPSDDVASNRLASTAFVTDGSKIADKASIFIGGKNYQFTTDADAVAKDATKVYIGDLVDEEGKINPADTDTMTKLNERITVAAKDNEVYTVGYDRNRLTFTEKVGYTTGKQEYDLTKLSEIERSLGYAEADGPSKGSALTLQIGDTSDSFNQMSVSVGDMHTTGMGIADIDISTQAGAQAAVQTIKDAINYVSGVRGDLGAIQNRLEHTGNNLSVMAENIQDAESTIRDTDVAEEMMSYVKNNILVQSAQAMLAQANQVPQGVLQLLG